MDKSIARIQETANKLLQELRDGDTNKEEAQRRKDEIIAEIGRIRTTLQDSDGQTTTIET